MAIDTRWLRIFNRKHEMSFSSDVAWPVEQCQHFLLLFLISSICNCFDFNNHWNIEDEKLIDLKLLLPPRYVLLLFVLAIIHKTITTAKSTSLGWPHLREDWAWKNNKFLALVLHVPPKKNKNKRSCRVFTEFSSMNSSSHFACTLWLWGCLLLLLLVVNLVITKNSKNCCCLE